jgi:hypothetical protein
MKRGRLDYAESEKSDKSTRKPAAEMVALDDELLYEDEERPQPTKPTPPPPPALLQNRVSYTVHDNAQYYESASMFVMIYGHVKQGISVASLFLPRENTNPEYDF